MKTIITIAFTIIFLGTAFSQDKDKSYMNKITDSACECISGIDGSKEISESETMRLGVCMIEASQPYKKEIMRDYGLDISLDKLEQNGEKLGQIIAMEMFKSCPESLMIFSEIADEEEETTEVQAQSISGKITKVEKGTFVCFHVKGDDGKSHKVYWLNQVESNLDLENDFESLKGKKVAIVYVEQDLFDPRINEYRNVKVLVALEK